jgi:hypothetical protein
LPTAFSRIERSPDRVEAATFLDLAEQVFDRFRPEILLTYGGHWLIRIDGGSEPSGSPLLQANPTRSSPGAGSPSNLAADSPAPEPAAHGTITAFRAPAPANGTGSVTNGVWRADRSAGNMGSTSFTVVANGTSVPVTGGAIFNDRLGAVQSGALPWTTEDR